MILIEAKKMDDERRLKRSISTLTEQQQQQQLITSTPGSSQQQDPMVMMMMRTSTSTSTQSKAAAGELRWKWVEDYCWRRGCFRSQNQCNDKWDNLMRDYKKVRDYQRSLILNATPQQQMQSYWNMDKSERKERGLPSNMLPTIYDALVQVVEKKSSSPSTTSTSPSPAPALLQLPPPPIATTSAQPPKPSTSGALSLLLQQQQQQQQHVNVAALALPPPPFSSQPILYQPTTTVGTPSFHIHYYHIVNYSVLYLYFLFVLEIPFPGDSLLDSDTSSDSPAKRKRKEKRPAAAAPPTASSSKNEAAESSIASAMCKISEAIQESERRRDERHREMVALKQRRLEIEESRMEVNSQGMSSGLVEAINNLANSILALAAAANNNNSGPTPPPPPPS